MSAQKKINRAKTAKRTKANKPLYYVGLQLKLAAQVAELRRLTDATEALVKDFVQAEKFGLLDAPVLRGLRATKK